MKKLFVAFAVMAIMCTLAVVQPGFSADLMLESQINTVTVATDKNGNEYVRFIISEDKNLNGVAYKADTAVMAFGSTVEKAKTFTSGDKLKAIAQSNEYKGRTSYNILAFVQ